MSKEILSGFLLISNKPYAQQNECREAQLRSRVGILLILATLLLPYAGQAQESDSSDSFISKRAVSVAAVGTVPVITLVDSYYMWWKDDYKPFTFLDHTQHGHWLNEPGSLGIDKIGHLYTSYFFYHTNKNILLWGGHSRSTAMVTSASISAGLALLIEIGDGFSPYGFDYQDLVFNFTGLGYGILQDHSPFFENIMLKWSYIPTDALTFPPKFTEHYDGHIYWFSFDMAGLLGDSYPHCLPKFLQPAIGFSVADAAERREFVIGLDWNFNGIFGSEHDLPGLLGRTINMLHLPAPGVKFSPDAPPEWKLFLLN